MSDRNNGMPPESEVDDELWVHEPDSGPEFHEDPHLPDAHEDEVEDPDLFDLSDEAPERNPHRGPRRPPNGGRAADAPAGRAFAGGASELDDDVVDLPPEGSFPRWLVVVGVLLVLGAVSVGGVFWWYDRQLNPPGGPGEEVAVEIPRGASMSGISSVLERHDVIQNSMVFNFYASRQGAGGFRAGVYDLRTNMRADDVLAELAEGPDRESTVTEVTRVTIPEGLRVDEIVARIQNQVPRLGAEELQAALDDGSVSTSLRPEGQTSYEGLLFPATYEVSSSLDAAGVLELLSDEMATRVARFDVDSAQARIQERYGLDLSPYEFLIVASLVQAEAGNPDEAPKIAAVIYNRLAENSTAWTLGIDASDEYGARLSGVDLATYWESDEPYNTRRVVGLPPTPIGAPGDYAIDAAFDPAEGDWMYYVLTDPRTHTFAVTDAEFQTAKQECIRKGLGCG